MFHVFFWLGYCNSAVNPFIYGLCSRDFRYAFTSFLRRRLARPEVQSRGRKYIRLLTGITVASYRKYQKYSSQSRSEVAVPDRKYGR